MPNALKFVPNGSDIDREINSDGDTVVTDMVCVTVYAKRSVVLINISCQHKLSES